VPPGRTFTWDCGHEAVARSPFGEAAPRACADALVATGLLVAMAATFLAARALRPVHPAIGFVRAFAEAAMVGGLADWFAVTALFRHPLGLPIPHTAIIPRNKDRIGETLAAFLRDNFLIPGVVARRMRGSTSRARPGAGWRIRPAPRGGCASGASRLAADMLESLDQERLGGMVKARSPSAAARARHRAAARPGADRAIAEGRHAPLLDGIIRWAAKMLEANEHMIRAMVHERAGSVMRWTGLDETLANKIIDGLDKLIGDMAEDPDHPLRAKAEEGWRARARPAARSRTARRVEAFKAEMLDNPAMQRWLDGLWESARAALLRAGARSRCGAGRPARRGAAPARRDAAARSDAARHDQPLRPPHRGRRGADYGDGIVRLVSDTVRGWDARTITGRLENAVGRDLQYIRINGTLVGGLVGRAN
jgi:uncharacterized membrane-anchored protein YjiN (DUF445 family)